MKDEGLLGFDGAFPDHLPPKGVSLQNYTELSRRAFAVELMKRYVPSKIGSDQFKEICQGRAELARSTKDFFSTCGELVMFMWYRMGYRGLMLNRDVELPTGVQRQYHFGRNMEYIFSRSQKEHCWVSFKAGETPESGDVIFVSNGPPHTEHVCIFWRVTEDGEWETFDAGQYEGDRLEQECKTVKRKQTRKLLGSRLLMGWVDLSKLELVVPANLAAPEA